jgi:hypothetical protein
MVVLPGSSKFRFGRSVEAQSSACLFVPLAATVFPFDASGSPGSGDSALGEPGVTLKVQELIERQPRHSRVLKRTGDIVFSLAMLSICSPLLVLLVLLVKITSRGPVFLCSAAGWPRLRTVWLHQISHDAPRCGPHSFGRAGGFA